MSKTTSKLLIVFVVLCAVAVVAYYLQPLFTTPGTQQQTEKITVAQNSSEVPIVALRYDGPIYKYSFVFSAGVVVHEDGSGLLAVAFSPYSLPSTMESLVKAKQAVELITNIHLNTVDIIVYFEGLKSDDVVDGPSASAAIAVAITAVIENKKIDNTYIISAEIDEFGNLLPVGGITEKWLAVANSGGTLVVSSEQTGVDWLSGVVKVSNLNELVNLVLGGDS